MPPAKRKRSIEDDKEEKNSWHEGDNTPARKRNKVSSDLKEKPDGMTKKEYVALLKRQAAEKHKAAGNDTARAPSPTKNHNSPSRTAAAKAPPSSDRKVSAKNNASVPSKRFSSASAARESANQNVQAAVRVSARRTAVSSKSAANRAPRRGSAPFNSPTPSNSSAGFVSNENRNRPNMPDFASNDDMNNTLSPRYLSPRSLLARKAIDDEGHMVSSSADAPEVQEQMDSDSPSTLGIDIPTFVESENIHEDLPAAKENTVNMVSPTSNTDGRELLFSAEDKKPSSFPMYMIVTTVFIAFVAFLCSASPVVDVNQLLLSQGARHGELACYKSNVVLEEGSEETSDRCRDVAPSQWLSCPEDAVCFAGIVQECKDQEFHTVAPNNDKCVLNKTARDEIAAIVHILEQWTISHSCNPGGNPFAVEDEGKGYPLFGFSHVLGELEIEWNPKLVSIIQDIEGLVELVKQPDKNYLVGLHPTRNLILPSKCRLKKSMLWCMKSLSGSLFRVMGWITSTILEVLGIFVELFREAPLLTLIFCVMIPSLGFVGISFLLNRRREDFEKRQLILDRATFRQEVYRFLQNDPNKVYAALAVRDSILFSPNLPYHSNSSLRKRLTTKVWPKIVADIEKDNRVAKSRIQTSAGVRDAWKWLD